MQQQGAGEHVCNQPGFLDSSHKPFFSEAQLSRHITLTGEELKPILVARSYSVSSIAPQPTNAMLLRRRRMVCTWLASAFLHTEVFIRGGKS